MYNNNQANKKGNVRAIIVVIVIIALACIISSFNGKFDEVEAWTYAQKVVRDNLKNPSTAEFCSISDAYIFGKENEYWIVEGYVDAQNSFGAMKRADFIVDIDCDGNTVVDFNCVISER